MHIHIILQFDSLWSSPALLVTKKHTNSGEPGKRRLVVDFRRVNEQIVDTSYPLITFDEIFHTLKPGK